MTHTTSLPVLVYHAIDELRSSITVSPTVFARTMRRLARDGWRTLSEAEALAGRQAGRWPARSFVLHFDDGFASVKTHAWPVLQDLGFTATVFVVSEWVGRTNDWPGQPASVPRAPLMTWDDLGMLGAAGWTLGGHTANHPRLGQLEPHRRHEEIGRGFEAVQRLGGQASRVFAYPYGAVDPVSIVALKRYADVSYGTRLGLVTAVSPTVDAPRMDAHYLGNGSVAPHLQRWPVRASMSVRQAGRALRGAFDPKPIVVEQ